VEPISFIVQETAEAQKTGFAIDPSFLQLLLVNKINMDGIGQFEFYIPEILDRTVSEARDKDHYRDLLEELFDYFSYRNEYSIHRNYFKYSRERWQDFYDKYSFLSENRILRIIGEEEADAEVYEHCMSFVHDEDAFDVEMSPGVNVLGDITGKLLGFSRSTGIPVLSKTRRMLSVVRGKIHTLEAADALKPAGEEQDHPSIHKWKREIFGSMFHLRSERGKWYVSFLVPTASMCGEPLQVGTAGAYSIALGGFILVVMNP